MRCASASCRRIWPGDALSTLFTTRSSRDRSPGRPVPSRHGPGRCRRPLQDQAVPGADGRRGVEHRHHHVDVLEGVADLFVETVAEGRARTVETRGVDEDRLEPRPVQDAAHRSSRGIGPGRGDGDLGPEDLVDQGRLADVGPTDDRDESRPQRVVGHVTPVGRPRRNPSPSPTPSVSAGRYGSCPPGCLRPSPPPG